MKVLITGGAGYIGSHTIIAFLEKSNHTIISVDNYSNSTPQTYKRINQITGKEISYYDIDLTDLKATKKIFQQHPDIKGIIHFAAYKSVSESVENPLLYYHNNIQSLIHILSCQKEFNIPHLIFSSSCSVYGRYLQSSGKRNNAFGKSSISLWPYQTNRRRNHQKLY